MKSIDEIQKSLDEDKKLVADFQESVESKLNKGPEATTEEYITTMFRIITNIYERFNELLELQRDYRNSRTAHSRYPGPWHGLS